MILRKNVLVIEYQVTLNNRITGEENIFTFSSDKEINELNLYKVLIEQIDEIKLDPFSLEVEIEDDRGSKNLETQLLSNSYMTNIIKNICQEYSMIRNPDTVFRVKDTSAITAIMALLFDMHILKSIK